MPATCDTHVELARQKLASCLHDAAETSREAHCKAWQVICFEESLGMQTTGNLVIQPSGVRRNFEAFPIWALVQCLTILDNLRICKSTVSTCLQRNRKRRKPTSESLPDTAFELCPNSNILYAAERSTRWKGSSITGTLQGEHFSELAARAVTSMKSRIETSFDGLQ